MQIFEEVLFLQLCKKQKNKNKTTTTINSTYLVSVGCGRLVGGQGGLFFLPIHTSFSDLNCVSRPQRKVYVLVRLRWNFVRILITSSSTWIYITFCLCCCTCSRKITGIFPRLKKNKKKLTLPFSQTLLKWNLSTLRDYNLARGLRLHCRFVGLDFVSGSKACQKCKVQIVLFRFSFRFLPTVV